jgi:hypothetical protein
MSTDPSWLRRAARGAGAAAVAALLVVLGGGCPGSLENKDDFLAAGGGGGAPGPSTSGQGAASADDPCDGLITETCAVAGCHVPDRTPPDLTLEGRIGRIRDVEADVCDGLLVDTQNPEQSLIYTKCAEEDPPCGNQMPFTKTPLDDEELACLLAWIETL